MRLCLLVFLVLLAYGGFYWMQEMQSLDADPTLPQALPAPVQRIALGYLTETGAETLFVRSAVFLGGLPPQYPPEKYADDLAQNFEVMTKLHPRFVDPYYLAQSSLAHISPYYARKANDILQRGMEALPHELILPFFKGFNYFHYMKMPKEAGETFAELATREGAPSWLGHLGATLSAQGGDLYGGLLTLQVMAATEEDELMKARYERSIAVFKHAIAVFEATREYQKKYDQYPETLESLVPEFLPRLPELNSGFKMQWDPPVLKLERSENDD